jgi:hypothetical protein
MSSTLTWLDYSDRDRRRALDVVDLLRESSTVDELGLGLVRDAFADLLFPGTSTIQTRARYFLFVPWIPTVVTGDFNASWRNHHHLRNVASLGGSRIGQRLQLFLQDRGRWTARPSDLLLPME